MGVQTTQDSDLAAPVVALFDSTDGIAFGPTFESAEHADDYLAFCRQRADESDPGTSADVRTWPPARHLVYYADWFRERVDGETGELLETPTTEGSTPE